MFLVSPLSFKTSIYGVATLKFLAAFFDLSELNSEHFYFNDSFSFSGVQLP